MNNLDIGHMTFVHRHSLMMNIFVQFYISSTNIGKLLTKTEKYGYQILNTTDLG